MAQPHTTVSQILVALARGWFTKAEGIDRQGYLGAEGDPWVWDNGGEQVVIDHHLLTIRAEIHNGADYWFVDFMTGKIEGN